ncbi:MAG: hypothetical protein CFH02_00196 [Alphaproteobacteria bacterium MarineAlpha3_Bin1]|nr:MAG: hypothetical protein CFH02_00196 [Alphaproteobacteria bacterium MarineAlpha3_Bin1]
MADKGPLKDVYLPEVLFEWRRVGKSLRVTAIDSITGTAFVMVAPAKATRKEIKQFAAMKLAYVLSKTQGGKVDGEVGGLEI